MPATIRVTQVTLAAALLAGGAFFAGRVTAPDDTPAADKCLEARQLVDDKVTETEATDDSAATKAHGLMVVTVILQNQDCFSVEERAMAQAVVDAQDRQDADN